jgi:hypothetical protein
MRCVGGLSVRVGGFAWASIAESMLIHKVALKRIVIFQGGIAQMMWTRIWPATSLKMICVHMLPELTISGPRCHALRGRDGLVPQTSRTIPGTDKCVAVRDRPAPFGRHRREMSLTVILPFVSNDPIETFVAVLDVFLRLHKPACHPPPHTCQDVLISTTLR